MAKHVILVMRIMFNITAMVFSVGLPLEKEGCQWTAYTQFSWPANTDSKVTAYVVSVSTRNQRKSHFFLKVKKKRPFLISSVIKATTFIIYQYFNSLLTLNRSLKMYFAASPAYHVNTNTSPIASKWYHKTPIDLSENFEVNSDIISAHILRHIYISKQL